MPALGYWKIRGLAQPIRLLLNYVGEEFEDVRYEQGPAPDFSRESWYSVKYSLGFPFPNFLIFWNKYSGIRVLNKDLPYYIDGDVRITQSNAILRYIARKHNLMGKTEQEIVNCDIMIETAMDFRNGTVTIAYNPNYEQIKKEYFKNIQPILLQFENYLGVKPWFAGDNISVCDFPMYELLDQHKIMKPGILDPYPKLMAYGKRFEELPDIKKYMSSNNFLERPVNSNIAGFK